MPELLAIAAFAATLACIVLAVLDSRPDLSMRQSEPYEADSHPGRYRTADRQLVDSNH
jgi:hypothetical protein